MLRAPPSGLEIGWPRIVTGLWHWLLICCDKVFLFLLLWQITRQRKLKGHRFISGPRTGDYSLSWQGRHDRWDGIRSLLGWPLTGINQEAEGLLPLRPDLVTHPSQTPSTPTAFPRRRTLSWGPRVQMHESGGREHFKAVCFCPYWRFSPLEPAVLAIGLRNICFSRISPWLFSMLQRQLLKIKFQSRIPSFVSRLPRNWKAFLENLLTLSFVCSWAIFVLLRVLEPAAYRVPPPASFSHLCHLHLLLHFCDAVVDPRVVPVLG